MGDGNPEGNSLREVVEAVEAHEQIRSRQEMPVEGDSHVRRGRLGAVLPEEPVGRHQTTTEGTVQANLFIAAADEDFAVQNEVKEAFTRVLHKAVLAVGSLFDRRRPVFSVREIQPAINRSLRLLALRMIQ